MASNKNAVGDLGQEGSDMQMHKIDGLPNIA